MTSTEYKNLASLDFDDYQKSLREYLRTQSKFKDYNFEGSNFSVLIRLMAQHAYTVGFTQNMLNAESHLDSAQLLDSVISKAKELNYVPGSRSSATAYVDIVIVAANGPPSLIIPKYYTMQSTNGLLYSTIDETVVYNTDGQYKATAVAVAEGKVVTDFFIHNENERFIVSSPELDITSVVVEVQSSVNDTYTEVWSYAEDLYGLTSDSKVYFIQAAPGGRYEIVFGNSITGKALEFGNVVKVTYRISNGYAGNGMTMFTPVRAIDSYSNITITLNGEPTFGGSEKEDIDSIKFNAPRHYASQGNCVSPEDYIATIKRRFPSIDKVMVYSGGELPQKRYGYTVISAKPHGADLLTQSLKDSIITYVSSINEASITPIYVDPEFFHIALEIKALYTLDNSNKTSGQIITEVLAGVRTYSNASLNNFGSSLRLSRLSEAIDSSSDAVISNETSARIIKRIRPQLGIGQSFEILFDNRLSPHNGYTITSSDFFYRHDNITNTCFFRDDGTGAIHLYTYDVDNKPFPLVNRIGEVDYVSGKVNLNSLVYESLNGNYVSIYASTLAKDIEITKNKILSIDLKDVNVVLELD